MLSKPGGPDLTLASADPLRPTMDLLPEELLVFSSDFPHQEGRAEAVKICNQQLGDLEVGAREQFFGGSIASLLGL